MILRPVSPQSPTGPPMTNRPVGLMWYLVRLSIHLAGSTGFRISSMTASRRCLVLMSSRMLGGQHHRLEAHRLIVLVAQGHLALGIGPQPRELAVLAHLRLALHQPVRERDGRRHQHVGLVGRVAEHQTLIARALLALVLAVDALGDVGRLLADDVEHAAARAVEAHVRGVVADVEHGLAHQRLHIDPGARGDLAGDDHHAGLDQGLAGHAAARIGRKNGIEHRIGYLIGDLVRVALGDRFRGE